MDESVLIRAAQQGDERAFEQLVRLYDQNVLRLALNLLRSQEDAHDIYQETFLRVYKNLQNFRFDCSFHTWLYRIVTNLCLDALRKRKVRREENPVIETSNGPMDRMDTVEEERADGDEADGDNDPLIHARASGEPSCKPGAEDHREQRRYPDHAAVDGAGGPEGGVGGDQPDVAEHEQRGLTDEKPEQAVPPGDRTTSAEGGRRFSGSRALAG